MSKERQLLPTFEGYLQNQVSESFTPGSGYKVSAKMLAKILMGIHELKVLGTETMIEVVGKSGQTLSAYHNRITDEVEVRVSDDLVNKFLKDDPSVEASANGWRLLPDGYNKLGLALSSATLLVGPVDDEAIAKWLMKVGGKVQESANEAVQDLMATLGMRNHAELKSAEATKAWYAVHGRNSSDTGKFIGYMIDDRERKVTMIYDRQVQIYKVDAKGVFTIQRSDLVWS